MSERVRVVDLLRLVAAFQMVQGHTLDAVLAEHLRAGAWFAAWSTARGLTSVAFLFVTGLAFHLATVAALDRHLRDPAAIRRRLRRGALLIGLGYLLHAPLFSLGAGLPAALQAATVVDVLHTIGISLWLLEGTVLMLRSARAAALCWGVLGFAALALSPLAARVVPAGPLLPLLQFVTPRGGSVFPLVPWAGHVLLGAALAPFLLPTDARQRALRFAVAAVVLAALAAVFGTSGLALGSAHLGRLSAVLAVGAVLAVLEPLAARLPAWAWLLSGETLFIYVVHILIAYGSGPSLRTLLGPTLSLLPALGIALLVLLFTGLSALAYPRLIRGLARGAAAG